MIARNFPHNVASEKDSKYKHIVRN